MDEVPARTVFRRPVTPERDIEITKEIEMEKLAVSRGDSDRKLERTDRYDRRARVVDYQVLTRTGTVRILFEVVDEQPFVFIPGYFVGIRAEVPDVGACKSPYCITSPPNDDRTFQLIVRLVPEGPLSCYLTDIEVGDVIHFRGPSGRSMVPKEDETELLMLATGVGVGPFLALIEYLAKIGFNRRIRLYWGLRMVDDICLLDELDMLVGLYPDFDYQISLSQPPPGWPGMCGRLTESLPPVLETLGGKHYYLVGNGKMIHQMSAVLSDLGVDEHLIYEEVYFNVKYRPEPEELAPIRARFVARDLFSPYTHMESGLFMPERPVQARR